MRTVIALLLSACAVVAAPPVEVPAEVKGEAGSFVTIRGKTDGTRIVYTALDPGLNVFPSDLLADKKATVVSSAQPGRYRVLAYSSVKDDPTEPAVVVVVIGNAPLPPMPPGPPPPAPAKTFNVFIVYESFDKLTTHQRGVVFGVTVEKYLDEAIPGQWRRREKDVVGISSDTPELKRGWEDGRNRVTTVPSFLIVRDGVSYVEPIGKDLTTFQAVDLLKKYREGK